VLKGDAASVQFVGAAGSFSAGPVPAGSYRVKVVYVAGDDAVEPTSVQVGPGMTATVTCRVAFQRCTAR